LKSKVKTIAITVSTVSSVAGVVSVSQSASAQLNVGRYGIQPGLEEHYLQYQVSGQDLSQMRGIPGCSVGFGASCNKAGAVFQQIVESNGGPTYEQLLMRAAGGEENFRNFASYYGDSPNLAQIPYASFWGNGDNPNIVDGYRYLLGQTVNRTPVEGLGQVTQNFYWSPQGGANPLDPRSALLDLKYSYGRLLLEEVAKIPDAQQQIQALGLEAAQTKYYSNKLSRSMRALKSGNEQSIKDSILQDLSMPFSPDGGEFNRPNLGIPPVTELTGETLAGEVFVGDIASLQPEAISLDIPASVGAEIPSSLTEVQLVPETAGRPFPSWIVGGGALALLLLLLSFGGDSSASAQGPSFVPITPSVDIAPPSDGNIPLGNGLPPGDMPIIEVPGSSSPPGQEVQQVPEPTMVTPVLFMVIFIYILSVKHWRIQTRN
jgi:hypothetical protein